MKVIPMIPKENDRRKNCGGFSLVEVLVGFAVTGVVACGLFLSFAMGFNVVKVSRENARATQVLMEKLEVFRLYSWDQVTNQTFVPTNFTSPFVLNESNPGFYYQGTVTVTNAPVAAGYQGDMRLVTVGVNWVSGGITRHREVSTLVSRYGIQNYTY